MKGLKNLKNNKGQSVVEFALILPVLLLVLMGVMEFGLMLNDYLSISNASRDGARYASLGETDANVVANIQDLLPGIDPGDLSISITPSHTSRDRGDKVTVQINYIYNVNMPVINVVISDTVPLNAKTTMRVE